MNEYDFIQFVYSPQLLDEIATAGLPAPDRIDTVGSSVSIFYGSPLTDDQQTALAGVVAAHVANPSYVPLVQAAQVSKLIAYLNSATPAVANTARAQMVLAMAPKLPPDLIAAVNANIQSIVGF